MLQFEATILMRLKLFTFNTTSHVNDNDAFLWLNLVFSPILLFTIAESPVVSRPKWRKFLANNLNIREMNTLLWRGSTSSVVDAWYILLLSMNWAFPLFNAIWIVHSIRIKTSSRYNKFEFKKEFLFRLQSNNRHKQYKI